MSIAKSYSDTVKRTRLQLRGLVPDRIRVSCCVVGPINGSCLSCNLRYVQTLLLSAQLFEQHVRLPVNRTLIPSKNMSPDPAPAPPLVAWLCNAGTSGMAAARTPFLRPRAWWPTVLSPTASTSGCLWMPCLGDSIAVAVFSMGVQDHARRHLLRSKLQAFHLKGNKANVTSCSGQRKLVCAIAVRQACVATHKGHVSMNNCCVLVSICSCMCALQS